MSKLALGFESEADLIRWRERCISSGKRVLNLLDKSFENADGGDAISCRVAADSDDGVLDDEPRDRIGERAFEPVADFDAQAAIVCRDHEDGTVIDLLAPELPLLGDANRKLLDAFRLRAAYDQYRDLTTLALLEGTQPVVQRLLLAGIEPLGGPSQVLAGFMKTDSQRYGQLATQLRQQLERAARERQRDKADTFWSKRIADIQARRAAGQTMKQIAKAHNTSDTNILRVMRRFKIKESERAD